MSAEYLTQLFGLDGQTAVVIGATGVLGGALAEGLAKAGAFVVVAGRGAERGEERVRAIEKLGGKARFFAVDATSRESLKALLAATLKETGRVDILVNCAGVNAASSYLEASDDDWDRVLQTNLTSTHLACQIFARRMVASGTGGAILNIGSVTAHLPLSRVFAYSA
ncbi:MAG TPA: SDR family NAD(P)-dependent oxidoreductase [Pirellulales bacterium]|nr:SDR family NAD(P)-dependent oxidoreductase [Pirellulales bacterium]